MHGASTQVRRRRSGRSFDGARQRAWRGGVRDLSALHDRRALTRAQRRMSGGEPLKGGSRCTAKSIPYRSAMHHRAVAHRAERSSSASNRVRSTFSTQGWPLALDAPRSRQRVRAVSTPSMHHVGRPLQARKVPLLRQDRGRHTKHLGLTAACRTSPSERGRVGAAEEPLVQRRSRQGGTTLERRRCSTAGWSVSVATLARRRAAKRETHPFESAFPVADRRGVRGASRPTVRCRSTHAPHRPRD